MIAATLFDLDGVLVDSIEVWFRVMNDLAGKTAAGPITRKYFEATWGQSVESDTAAFFPGCSVEQVESFYQEHFMEHIDQLVLTPGAAVLFRRLHDDGCATAVITNTPTRLAARILEYAEISPDALVGSSDVVQSKPAPEMVFRACELLKVDPQVSLVIGDSRYDRDAAAAAAVRFVGYRTAGDARIESLDQLVPLSDLKFSSRPCS